MKLSLGLDLRSYRWIQVGVGDIDPTTVPASVLKAAAKAENVHIKRTGHNPFGFTVIDGNTVIAVG